nr:spore germination protein [Sulfobacillus harzensis]
MSDNIKTAGAALEVVNGTDMTLLKDIITETSTLEKRLSGFATDLAGSGSLDEFSGHVEAAYERLKNTVGQSPDIIIRRFYIGSTVRIPAVLAFVDGLSDSQIIDQDTIMVSQEYDRAYTITQDPNRAHQIVHDSVVASGHLAVETSWNKLLVKLMGGNTILFIEGTQSVLVVDTVKYPARSISTPTTERTVMGSQEAFNEVILTQMNLIRMRIKSPDLHFDNISVGSLSHTNVAIAHIEGLTNPAIVRAAKERLAVAQLAEVQTGQELIPYLTDGAQTLFPLIRRTERPDVVARELSMGKIAILVDTTPFVMLAPNTLMDFYQTIEDYTMNSWYGTLERLIRFLGLFLGLLLPPLYIALTSVNPDLLPTKLVLTIAGSRVGLPFPPIFEVMTMWAIIEVLREAALRLPKELSQTLGTVGAIVVGTAIVKAGIVSPLMIVIITLTALGLFTSPSYEMAVPWRVLFWFLITASYFLGLYGIILALLMVLAHLASLEVFGVPYLSPFGPYRGRDIRDTFVRFPTPMMTERPRALETLQPQKSANYNLNPGENPPLHRVAEERVND